MNREVEKLPGAVWNFSQPIEDNVGETVTGTKGQLAAKTVRRRPEDARQEGTGDHQRDRERPRPQGPEAVSRRRPAEPELHRRPPAGGALWHQRVRRAGRRRSGRRRQGRQHGAAGRGAVRRRGALSGALSPRSARRSRTSACSRPRESASRWHSSRRWRCATAPTTSIAKARSGYVAITFNVRGRDLNTTVEDAMRLINQKVKLPPGYHVDWAGEYESAKRADRRGWRSSCR